MADNKVPQLVTALSVLYTISALFTALRVYVRVFISKNWGLDDSLLMATLVGSARNQLTHSRYDVDRLHRASSQYIRLRRL
jgi:hypothetical protein